MNIKMEIKDTDVVVDPATFQPIMRINVDIRWGIEAMQDGGSCEGSVLNEVSAHKLGKELINAVQEQMKEKRMNEGN